jgi:hypothetical protein
MESLLREPFRRFDESPDAFFYRQPRFVTHIDEPAGVAVTQLYREVLPAGGAVLDLMSSWVSHLPPEVMYRRVVGLGMNEDELAANPRLDAYKAVAIWQALDDSGHARLIERYLDEAGNWRDIQSLDRSPQPGFSDPLLAVIARAS